VTDLNKDLEINITENIEVRTPIAKESANPEMIEDPK
jgi:hypothetical protein